MLHELRAWIRVHPGCQVISDDDPEALEIGYSAIFHDGESEIRTRVSVPVRSLLSYVPPNMLDYFRSAAGRIELASVLQNSSPLLPPEEVERPVYPTAWDRLFDEDLV